MGFFYAGLFAPISRSTFERLERKYLSEQSA